MDKEEAVGRREKMFKERRKRVASRKVGTGSEKGRRRQCRVKKDRQRKKKRSKEHERRKKEKAGEKKREEM